MQQLNLWSSCCLAVEVGEGSFRAGLPPPPARTVQDLRVWLGHRLQRTVHLAVTDNRSTMLSCREEGNVLLLRLHRMFTAAPEAIWNALVDYLDHDDVAAGRVLDAFIMSHSDSAPCLPIKVRPKGRFHDLQAMFDDLNRTYFHEASRARITWGAAGNRRRRHSIQLGCYVADDQLIRIHPSLDQSFVPPFYVAWITFHEMLHEVFGVSGHGGPNSVHPAEFIAIEESYSDFERCKKWEAKNLERLLRYRPSKRRSR